MTKAKSMSQKSNGLRRPAEKILPQEGKALQRKPSEDGEKLVHELQVHRIELERQKMELRKAFGRGRLSALDRQSLNVAEDVKA